MVIAVRQIKSNFENRFEITENNRLLYTAQTPWMSVSAPFQAENLRRLTLTDSGGNVVFTTAYHVLENTLEQAVPLKYLFTGQQKFSRYDIIGQTGRLGSFYTRQDGLMDEKYCLEFGSRELLGYGISKGKFAVVSIYDGEEQIAQITKPLAVVNNLDLYYLHIADSYEDMLPLLAFFTIYYDDREYANRGQAVGKSARVSYRWTWSKTNRFYQPDWIARRFGQSEAERLDREIGLHRQKVSADIKRTAKIVGLCFLIGIPLILLVLYFLVWR